MPFEQNLDKEIFSETLEIASDFGTTKLTIGVLCYNEGVPKMQISRERADKDGQFAFAKLGRLTKQEAEDIIPIMQKAIEKM